MNTHNYWVSIFNIFSEIHNVTFDPSAIFGVIPQNVTFSKYDLSSVAFASLIKAPCTYRMETGSSSFLPHEQWLAHEVFAFGKDEIYTGRLHHQIS